MKNSRFRLILSTVVLLFLFVVPLRVSDEVLAQSNDIIWTVPVNISNSPGRTSTDPFLLSDPAGVVHLFFTEKLSLTPGNQPETVLYSQWNGKSWSNPIDLFFAPVSDGTLLVSYPHAVLDDNGIIHLIWMSQPNFPSYTLNYSSAPAGQAQFVQAWQPRTAIADDLNGTKYSIHLAFQPPNTIHVIYSSGLQSDVALEEPGVKYLQSPDGGLTWSEPVKVFSVTDPSMGTSDVRIIATDQGLFASWTMWSQSGNGEAIFFARSLDGGETWDRPIVLSERRDGEYERDWNALKMLPDNQLMAIWEGGYRAYRHAMFSDDLGETWSEPWDLFPRLIGENGFVEFLTDSNGELHLFYSQRIREGAVQGLEETVSGLWHSVYEGDRRWSDPTLSGGVHAMLNPKVAIVNGNTVMATWYTSGNNDFEILLMTGTILGAPAIEPQPWADEVQVLRNTPVPTPTPDISSSPVAPSNLPEASPGQFPTEQSSTGPFSNPAMGVLVGVLPALVIIPLIFLTGILKKKE